MKTKDQVKLIYAVLLAPLATNASDLTDQVGIEEYKVNNYSVIFPNEKIIVADQNGEFSISHRMIIDQIKKQVQIDEDMPLEIYIHEESTNIDINLGDIGVTVSIEKASRPTLNVITRKTHDFKLGL